MEERQASDKLPLPTPTREELEAHLKKLGFSETLISAMREIPQEVLLLSSRPLTPAERAYGLTLAQEMHASTLQPSIEPCPSEDTSSE